MLGKPHCKCAAATAIGVLVIISSQRSSMEALHRHLLAAVVGFAPTSADDKWPRSIITRFYLADAERPCALDAVVVMNG